MKKIKIRRDCMDYITVLLMILCSGTVIFNIKYNSIFIPIFCLFALVRSMILGRYKVNQETLLVVVGLIVFNGLLHAFDGVAWNGLIQIALYAIGTAKACASMSFERYKRVYTTVLCYLTVFAILVFLGVVIGVIGHRKIGINGAFYQMSLLHVVGWGDTVFNTRMCGLFHEPGMFQIILNIGILYVTDNILRYKVQKKDIKQLMILVVGVLLTRSTTGYIIMCIILSALYIRIYKYLKKALFKIVYYGTIPVTITLGYKLLSSEVVVNKFTSTNVSYSIRTNDLYSGLSMFALKPFFGYGYNSKWCERTAITYGMDSMSNGVMGMLLMFGVLTTVILLYLIIKRTGKINWRVNKVLVITVLMLEEMTESCFFFPVSLAFLFAYYKDGKFYGGKK